MSDKILEGDKLTQSKMQLEEMYHTHHQRGKRYGYLFCHGERGRYLHQWVGTGKRVLDIGCRDGTLTKFFSTGNQVTGVDIDRHALELAKAKLGIETLWLDINSEFPFAPESFDVVVACEIMEHLFHTQEFLDKITKILKPGGLFLGSVPNAFRMRNRWKFLFGKEYETDPTHVHQFSYQRLKSLLEERFCPVQITPLGGSILPFLPVSEAMPLRLNRLYAKDQLWRAEKPVRCNQRDRKEN